MTRPIVLLAVAALLVAAPPSFAGTVADELAAAQAAVKAFDFTAATPHCAAALQTYAATLKCRDPNGELYNVTLSRSRVSLTSYSDDAVRTKVETWADTVPALA